MRTLLCAVVIAASLASASGALAEPIVYDFSGIYSSFEQNTPPPYWGGHPPPSYQYCNLCPQFSGRLTSDADSGVIELELLSPIVGPSPILDLGGIGQVNGSYFWDATAEDRDNLFVEFNHPYQGHGTYPYYDGASYFYNETGYGGLYIAQVVHPTGLWLSGPGLISGGQLRSGLTIDDLNRAYIWQNWNLVIEGTVYSTSTAQYCPQGQTLECVQSGDYDAWHNEAFLVEFRITEIHQVVPEPTAGRLAALAVLGLLVARPLVCWAARVA